MHQRSFMKFHKLQKIIMNVWNMCVYFLYLSNLIYLSKTQIRSRKNQKRSYYIISNYFPNNKYNFHAFCPTVRLENNATFWLNDNFENKVVLQSTDQQLLLDFYSIPSGQASFLLLILPVFFEFLSIFIQSSLSDITISTLYFVYKATHRASSQDKDLEIRRKLKSL